MNTRIVLLLIVITAGFSMTVIFFPGCSGNNPVTTLHDQNDSDIPVLTENIPVQMYDVEDSGRDILGQWIIDFDTTSGTASVTPDRNAAFRFDVTTMLPTPTVNVNSYDALTGVLDVDVTMSNPNGISGYDLRLIIFNNNGHNLINSDDWTDAWDLPAGLPINPFKSYATDYTDRVFHAYSQVTENLRIYCPGGNTYVRFAIDIAYPGNCTEPYEIDNYFQETLLDDMGASANIWIEVFDWQNDVGSVSLYCPAITAENLVHFTQVDNTLFQLELVNNTAATAGVYSGVIIAYSSGVPLFDFVKIKISVEQNTIGLIQNLPGAFEGYTLFAPGTNPGAYLFDMDGNLVHSWESEYIVGSSCYLLENGNLLYSCRGTGPGAIGGRIEEIDWDGNLVWEYDFPAGEYRFHHDIERLPNGNTLFIAFEYKEDQETLDAGRDPEILPTRDFRPDSIIEIKPYGATGGNIVWEWHAWDHMSSEFGGTANGQPVSTDITDPGKLNINFPDNDSDDWLHVNAVDYNPGFDQIVLSSRHFSELWIIDHSTADYLNPQSGIEAARGPAGDILYRWGNPQSYGAGDESDQKYFGPHDIQWIESGLNGEGNILAFNNGRFRDTDYSSIDEIVTPVDEFGNYELIPGESYGPDEQSWIYTTEIPEDFFSGALSGTQRLPNGNTLICEGNPGRFFEVTPDEEIVWEYINPVTSDGPQKQGTIVASKVFRCYRYSADHPALAGRDLTPGDPIELPRE